MNIPVSTPFNPEHPDAKIILERCAEQPLDSLWWKMYDAGGFRKTDAEKIRRRLRESAKRLLNAMQ